MRYLLVAQCQASTVRSCLWLHVSVAHQLYEGLRWGVPHTKAQHKRPWAGARSSSGVPTQHLLSGSSGPVLSAKLAQPRGKGGVAWREAEYAASPQESHMSASRPALRHVPCVSSQPGGHDRKNPYQMVGWGVTRAPAGRRRQVSLHGPDGPASLCVSMEAPGVPVPPGKARWSKKQEHERGGSAGGRVRGPAVVPDGSRGTAGGGRHAKSYGHARAKGGGLQIYVCTCTMYYFLQQWIHS